MILPNDALPPLASDVLPLIELQSKRPDDVVASIAVVFETGLEQIGQ